MPDVHPVHNVIQLSLIHISAQQEDTKWEKAYEGYGTQTLEIRINGVLYQSFEVDFDEGKHRKEVDNSEMFTSGVPESSGGEDSSSSEEPEDEE